MMGIFGKHAVWVESSPAMPASTVTVHVRMGGQNLERQILDGQASMKNAAVHGDFQSGPRISSAPNVSPSLAIDSHAVRRPGSDFCDIKYRSSI